METITNPYHLAEAGLCQYSGDGNPIDHDGAWYNGSKWDSEGYAECVRITTMPDVPYGCHMLCVELITINKPGDVGLARALECCGYRANVDERSVCAEIEACLGYGYYDPAQNYYTPQSQMFIIPDDSDDLECRMTCEESARIHNAKITNEGAIWELLNDYVGKHSCDV